MRLMNVCPGPGCQRLAWLDGAARRGVKGATAKGLGSVAPKPAGTATPQPHPQQRSPEKRPEGTPLRSSRRSLRDRPRGRLPLPPHSRLYSAISRFSAVPAIAQAVTRGVGSGASCCALGHRNHPRSHFRFPFTIERPLPEEALRSLPRGRNR